jgi:hypothetical protein
MATMTRNATFVRNRYWHSALALAAAFLAGCAGTAATSPREVDAAEQTVPEEASPANAEDDEEGQTRFDWPRTGSVRVEEEVQKRGKTATLKFALDLKSDPASGLLEVRHRPLEVTADGRTLAVPGGGLDPVTAAVLPVFRVAPDGELVEVLEVEERVRAALAMMRSSLPEPQFEQLRSSPLGQRLGDVLTAKVTEMWGAWVENWTDFEPEPGEGVEFEMELPTAGDRTIPALGAFQHFGPVEGKPGLSRVRFEWKTKEGSDVDAGFAALVGVQVLPGYASLSIEYSAEAWIDLATLRPERVETGRRVRVTPKSGEPIEELERHTYRFDFSGAADTRPPARAN